jgi:hypothetical protein
MLSASGGITASGIQNTGTLTVVGTSTLGTTNVTGLLSASGNITASNIFDAGTLVVLGNTILTTVTASNISASGNISASLFVGAHTGSTFGTASWATNATTATTANALNTANNYTISGLTVNGNVSASGTFTASNFHVVNNVGFASSVTVGGSLSVSGSTVFGNDVTDTTTINGNLINSGSFFTSGSITASNISASGNISASNGWFNNLTVAGTLNATVSGSITNASSASIAANNSTATLQYITFVDGTGNRPLYVDQDSLTWQPSTNTLSSSGNFVGVNYTGSRITISGGTGNSTAVGTQGILSSNGIGVSGNSYFNGDVGIGTSLTVGGIISGSNALWLAGNATLAGNSATVTHTGTGNLSILSSNGSVVIEGSTFTGNDVTIPGDLAVNGGDITTTAATFNLITGSATTVNFAHNASALTIGATGSSTIFNGDIAVNGGDISTTASTFNFLTGNSATTTVNMLWNDATPTLRIRSTKDATAPGTAAVVVDGGVSIAKNLIVSGSTTMYGDLTLIGTGSIVNISSSTVIIGDNRIALNAWSVGSPQRYGGIDVFDSGSTASVTSSLLWDSLNNYWLLQTNNTGSPVTASSAVILQGPTSSFGSEFLLTVNNFLKVQTTTGNMITSSLSEVGNTLQYAGTISASVVTGSQVFGLTGSFINLALLTGSSPGVGTQVPASPNAAGLPGQIEVDNNFIYVYTNNIWKRVPVSVWSL